MRRRNARVLPRRAARRRQGGYTLAEITVVLAITSVMMIMAYSAIEQATVTTMFVEQHNDLPVFAQGAVNRIQNDVFQAKQIFDATTGPPYIAAMSLTSAPVFGGSLLPIINTSSTGAALVPDTAAQRYTGNELLIVREMPPMDIDLGGGLRTSVSIYRFELFYLTRKTTRNFLGSGGFLDLVAATSNPYADYTDVTDAQFTTAQKQTICTALRSGNVTDPVASRRQDPVLLAWDPSGTVSTSVHTVNSDGTFGAAQASPTIAMTVKSMMPGLSGGRISGKMNYTVAFPTTNTLVAQMSRDPVPLYAIANGNFPSGFEVLVIGPSGNRQVLVRLTIYAHYAANKLASQSVMVITSTPA
jgi:hypothetical protein